MQPLVIAALTVWVLAVTAGPAHAYLDPGSGSMLLQAVLGGAAGLAVVVKLSWKKLLALLGIGRAEKGKR